MKEPRKVASVSMSPAVQREIRLKDKLEKAKALIAEDQVWKHKSGTEYTTILVTNRGATKDAYTVTVCYYDPDGQYWSQSLDRFVEDKIFLRNYESAQTPAEMELGPWMSAGLEDPLACDEFKTAARNWLNELPFPK